MGDTCRGEGKERRVGIREGGREESVCACMREIKLIVDLHAQSVKEREAGEGDGGRGGGGGREGEGREGGKGRGRRMGRVLEKGRDRKMERGLMAYNPLRYTGL